MKSIGYYIGFVRGYFSGYLSGKIAAKKYMALCEQHGGLQHVPTRQLEKLGKQSGMFVGRQRIMLAAIALRHLTGRYANNDIPQTITVVSDYLDFKEITQASQDRMVSIASRGIIVAPPIQGDESDAELYARHFLGDTSVLAKFIADGLESRSASKALLQNPTALKDSLQGMSQIHRLRSQPFLTSEYRGSLVRCSEDQMGLTDDKKHNLRQYNSASLRVKVAYKRRLAAWARSLEKESLTAQCTATGWLERRTPVSPEGEQVGTYGFGRNGLVRKQVYGTPIPPRDLEDHSVDSVAIARMYRPGAESTEPVHTVFLDPELPKEVNDTIEKFIGDEGKKEEGRCYVVDSQPTEKLSDDDVLRFNSTTLNKEDKE